MIDLYPPAAPLNRYKHMFYAAGYGSHRVLRGGRKIGPEPGRAHGFQMVPAAAEAGARFVWANVVYLKPGTREHFLEFLDREYPHLLGRYRDIFPVRPPPSSSRSPMPSDDSGGATRLETSVSAKRSRLGLTLLA